MARGVDYSFNPHPSAAVLKAAGVAFAGRYVSSLAVNDTNGKNLLASELRALRASGLGLILFVEEGGQAMLGGKTAGIAHAQHFAAVTKSLGLGDIPGYFAADWDATEAQQGAINSYLDGAASVIGHGRTGIYGGFWPVSRALNGGHVKWACQTVAWSGSNVDRRVNVRQFLQVRIGGVSVDVLTGMTADYGQWPRPAAPVTPAKPPASPVKLAANGKASLRDVAHKYGISTDRVWWLTTQHRPDGYGDAQQDYFWGEDWDADMPEGMEYWVG